MDRRAFLGVALAGLGGCGRRDPGADPPAGDESPTEGESTPGQRTATRTRPPREGGDGTGPEEPLARATLDRVEFVTREGRSGTEHAVTGEVTNTGDIFLASLAVTATFERDGAVVDEFTMAMIDVGLGETWEFWMPCFCPDGPPETGTARVAGAEPLSLSRPRGLDVTESALSVPEGTDSPFVTGRVSNGTGGAVGLVETRVKFHADNGHILAGGTATRTNLAPAEEWPFTVVANSFNPDWNDRFADHEVGLLAVV